MLAPPKESAVSSKNFSIVLELLFGMHHQLWPRRTPRGVDVEAHVGSPTSARRPRQKPEPVEYQQPKELTFL